MLAYIPYMDPMGYQLKSILKNTNTMFFLSISSNQILVLPLSGISPLPFGCDRAWAGHDMS